MEPAYIYRATCDRVIDADTLSLRVDLGFYAALTIHGRLHGVNAPELSTPEGQQAKLFVMALIQPSTPLVVESFKDQRSFERWVVDVSVEGHDLGDLLVDAGHAVRE